MTKFVTTFFILYICSISTSITYDAANYIAYIEELSHDEKFIDEYQKWSLELFSHSDYLYGKSYTYLSCPIEDTHENINITPTSVHKLRPQDIKCVGAMGDSFTTGLGAHAITPIDLLIESRGMSWSIGGDYTSSKFLSLPNVLKKHNPTVRGFSTKVSAMFGDSQNATINGLNVAKSGDHSIDMLYQADLLIERLHNEKLCDWNDDWKLITLFAGTNDLCSFCEDHNVTQYRPEQYVNHIRDALDKLYNSSLPRTLINLVLAFDIRSFKNLIGESYVCRVLHKKLCPCATLPTTEQISILNNSIKQYYKLLSDLIESRRYENRDDFTVVIQPFMASAKSLYKDDHKIDFSYFGPDCFHFSGKGHSLAALSLWNNMLEPVGGKNWSWHIEQPLKCPTTAYPYIFTSKNSVEALKELGHATNVQITDHEITTTMNISTFDSNSTYQSQHHYKHVKHQEVSSDSSFNKMKLITVISFSLIITTILITGIVRRRKTRILIPNNAQGHLDGINNVQYYDDNDEIEVWSRNSIKSVYFGNKETLKSYGQRIPSEET